ncbi:MAG TPA: peptidase M28 [Microscillaceae bacterium]|nr:peptidase M28 [Microscillaceae bacterium]
MKKNLPTFLLVVLLHTLGGIYSFLQAQHQYFICPPCNSPCDTIQFHKGGICPTCRMRLKPGELPPKISSEYPILQKMKTEAYDQSQVMHTISVLSDVYGPRLMGTPNYYKSVQWIQKELKKWGIQAINTPSFDQKHRGWSVQNFSMVMVSPNRMPVQVYPQAYTAGTNGLKKGEVVLLENWRKVDQWKGKLKDKVVLLGNSYQPVSSQYQPFTRRFTNKQLKQAAQNPDPNHRVIGYLGRRSIVQAIRWSYNRRREKKEFFEFCKREGVIALVEASDYPYGILHADGNRNIPSYMHTHQISPIASFVMANEHFGRLVRLLKLGYKPQLEVNLQVKFYNNPAYNVNLLANIPGTDTQLKSEKVVIGGHLDSWHAGTGAVDNASGAAVMMEAMRILKKVGVQPRRTIQLALWGGEEQIFAGSRRFTAQTLGNIRTGVLKSDQKKITAYFNLDNGAGKIRGIYLMGNQSIGPYFQKHLKPFPKSSTLTTQYTDQTDHEFFDALNIPGFQFIQDPLDYISAIHHTNLDTYEYVPESDVKYNALLVAYLVYKIAQQDKMLPRKPFNSPKPSTKGNVTFRLPGFAKAKEVNLVGNFNNWSLFGTPMTKDEKGWYCRLPLSPGRYLYKFFIDGVWTNHPETPKAALKKDGKGHGGLTEIIVNK